FINLTDVIDRRGDVIGLQTMSRLPEYLMMDRRWSTDGMANYLVAQNTEISLFKTPKDFWSKPILLSVRNPNWFDASPDLFFWMGGEATRLRLFAPADGQIVLTAEFTMGPSLPEQTKRRVEVRSSASAQVEQVVLTASKQEIRVPVRQGIN